MIVHFSKYHGTGNDFIMVDGRKQDTSRFDSTFIQRMCHRRMGIGADGLIVLEESVRADFKMRYFNADGNEGTMCGNGGRCITRFAADLGVIGNDTTFEGIDGLHRAAILPDDNIHLELKDVEGVKNMGDGFLLDTGSPHFVQFVTDLDALDVEKRGREIRNQPRFGKGGVNVNFVTTAGSRPEISVRTYERGVEEETLSCGTGVTAAVICAAVNQPSEHQSYKVKTRGGILQVSFRKLNENHFNAISLNGPAKKVFEGTLSL